jgi:predicted Zn-ribbon and HTH transcriptional regulator
MYRKDLITLLDGNPLSVKDIARQLEMVPRDVEDDVRHLIKSLKHTEYQLHVTPARCRNCGFIFSDDKLHKPGKCPRCHNTWVEEPLLEIRRRT